MRVTNLILHIIAVFFMLPDMVFVGLNTLMGLGLSRGMDTIIILVAGTVYGTTFLVSTVGEIITFASYKKTRPIVYMRRELIIHGLSALCCVTAIIYMIVVSLHSSAHDYSIAPAFNLAGFVVSLAGIIVTVICSHKRKKAQNQQKR